MYCRGNAGFNLRSAYFVIWSIALCFMFCAVSSAYGEDFKTLLKKAERGDVNAQCEVEQGTIMGTV